MTGFRSEGVHLPGVSRDGEQPGGFDPRQLRQMEDDGDHVGTGARRNVDSFSKIFSIKNFFIKNEI